MPLTFARRHFLLLLLPLALLASSCSGNGDGGGATPAATATEAVATPVARPFPGDLQQQTRTILERTAEVRGLAVESQVAMNLISRSDATRYLRDSLTAEDRELFRIQQELYSLLGIYPEDTDLLGVFINLIGLGVAGFYEPDLKAFYLLDDLSGLGSRASETTIVHELTHALQDQHYDINAESDKRADDWDASGAYTSLLEGDAVNTEQLYFGESLRPQPNCFTTPAYSEAKPPYAVVRELNSWYDDGLCFVQAVVPQLEGGIDDVFADPPASTEQILHPERYLAGDEPVEVELPSLDDVLGEGWSETKSSTLGEFPLQNLLIVGLSSDRSQVQAAAEGWGGDRWSLYEKDGARLAALEVDWDTESDATEFFAALTQSVYNRASSRVPESDASFTLSFDDKTWYAHRDGERVIIVVSDDADAAQSAASSLGFPS